MLQTTQPHAKVPAPRGDACPKLAHTSSRMLLPRGRCMHRATSHMPRQRRRGMLRAIQSARCHRHQGAACFRHRGTCQCHEGAACLKLHKPRATCHRHKAIHASGFPPHANATMAMHASSSSNTKAHTAATEAMHASSFEPYANAAKAMHALSYSYIPSPVPPPPRRCMHQASSHMPNVTTAMHASSNSDTEPCATVTKAMHASGFEP